MAQVSLKMGPRQVHEPHWGLFLIPMVSRKPASPKKEEGEQEGEEGEKRKKPHPDVWPWQIFMLYMLPPRPVSSHQQEVIEHELGKRCLSPSA